MLRDLVLAGQVARLGTPLRARGRAALAVLHSVGPHDPITLLSAAAVLLVLTEAILQKSGRSPDGNRLRAELPEVVRRVTRW